MADEDKQSKTEQPTGKRRSDTEKKSGPPRSRELTSTLTLLASFLFLYLAGGSMFGKIKESCRELLSDAGSFTLTQATVYSLMLKLMGTLAYILLPFLLAAMSAGVVVSIGQGGF